MHFPIKYWFIKSTLNFLLQLNQHKDEGRVLTRAEAPCGFRSKN